MCLVDEQQGNGAVADGEVFDVVGQGGVQVADAVGPGECEVGAVILVDQRDSVSRIAVLGGLVAKLSGMAQANQTPIFAPAVACSAASGVARIVDGVAISSVHPLPHSVYQRLAPR